MAKIYEQESANVANVNIISINTTISGEIVAEGDCRIDGMLKGNIASHAKVIIGKQGIVEGNISCNVLDIEGKVNSDAIVVTDLLFLRAQAKLTGNISVGKIAIEPGADFVGQCKMMHEVKE